MVQQSWSFLFGALDGRSTNGCVPTEAHGMECSDSCAAAVTHTRQTTKLTPPKLSDDLVPL